MSERKTCTVSRAHTVPAVSGFRFPVLPSYLRHCCRCCVSRVLPVYAKTARYSLIAVIPKRCPYIYLPPAPRLSFRAKALVLLLRYPCATTLPPQPNDPLHVFPWRRREGGEAMRPRAGERMPRSLADTSGRPRGLAARVAVVDASRDSIS